MTEFTDPTKHDAYAADYDQQVQTYNCYVGDLLFGLCYEYVQLGQTLLDAGIGTGLSAQLFAKAGLEIYGMDFSPAMLEICQSKGFATELMLHDIQQVPWKYPSESFDHLVCCGVMHFIPVLEGIFDEADRVLRRGGYFAFTTRVSEFEQTNPQGYDRQNIDGFDIFSHSSIYIKSLIKRRAFRQLKVQNCFVGEDIFTLWVVQRIFM